MAIVNINKNPIASNDIIFDETPEFSKEIKNFNKKYNTIYDDIEVFKKALTVALPNKLPGTVQISSLGDGVKDPVYKVRKFRCQALSGNGSKSGFRIIYTYYPNLNMVYFIEAFHKNKKDNEDRKRIYKYVRKE